MSRGLIDEKVLDQIRARYDLVSVVGRHVRLIRAGNNFKGPCPFHHEKSPSFHVNRRHQIFYCFGCRAGGNVFEFMKRITGATVIETVRDLGQKVGIKVS